MHNTAFLFPGQGSQSLGMLADLAAVYPLVQTTFAEASTTLGYDLWELTQHDPEQRLNRTEYTQPALLTAGVACWRVWCSLSEQRPVAMAGHSLGEYTALVCAGALSFSAAVSLVALRGRLMQQAVPQGRGAMAAILGLEDDQVIELCARISAVNEAADWLVSAANFNAPGQVVIAGQAEAVAAAVTAASDAGARRAQLLPVSVPSHCALMQPAAEQLRIAMARLAWQPPRITVIHNVDARARQHGHELQQALAAQLYQPVRWTDCVLALQASGVDSFAECGPGRVLAGLVKRIGNGRDAPMYSLSQADGMQALASC